MEKVNNYDLFLKLRSEYKKFIYKKYNVIEDSEKVILEFFYSLDNKIDLKNIITIWKKDFNFIVDFEDELVNSVIFNIGIAEAISYYKTTCSKEFIVESGYLDDYQRK